MDKTFQKFLRSGIDLSPLGIERREDNTPYFCTPKGASVFGWAGVDGIHFCFIRGFGGTVFSVSPMNTAPDYVHPLAYDFADFLRLLLACGNAAAPEQACMWDEEQFAEFLRENPPTPEQQTVLDEISGRLHLTPAEHPWAYLREVQSSFDYSRIRYTEEIDDPDMNPGAEPEPREWKVYFEGSFWGHHGKDRPGTEIPLGKTFTWVGHSWVIPAVYSCGRGLAADFCMRVEPEEIRAFMEKWGLDPENDPREMLTREQQMQLEWENPLVLNFLPRPELNGKPLRFSRGFSVCFNPCFPEEMFRNPEAKQAVWHYGLDTSCGWVISRNFFPWAGRRRPEIKRLSLTMEQRPGSLPGPHFRPHRPGDTFTFSHPISGTAYTLTVRRLEQQTVPAGSFGPVRQVYPTHAVFMYYTLAPETEEKILVYDCAESDRPREAAPEDPSCPSARGDARISIIGGADGPTAVLFGADTQNGLRYAVSSLHFAPAKDDVEWRLEFRVRQFDNLSLVLI